ncbi:hypothetical protein APY03_0597 [Variovorax sp. WDL1]|nr:hypothetical protein APY03_0597 [Variovorax sp. WDL1]
MATVEWTLTEHIERIAFLVHYGWSEAVAVDVGVPSLGCVVNWPLTDGNHRLGAALVRGDDVIAASVAGDIDYAFRLFGVDVRESDFETVPA